MVAPAATAVARARAGQHAQLVRQIHTAKRDLGLDDDTYRRVIARFSDGKTSSKDCRIDQLRAIVEHFHQSGWPRSGKEREELSPRQKKMWALWQTLADAGKVRSRSMAGLQAWVAGQTNPPVQCLKWLSRAQEMTIIESLKAWVER